MSEKIEYSMVPIKMADLASFIAAKKNMGISDAICYMYNSEFVAKLYVKNRSGGIWTMKRCMS